MKQIINNNDNEIRVLDFPESIQMRHDMYIDSSSGCFREIYDNAADETFSCPTCDTVFVSTNFNGWNFIADNGRGIPYTMSKDRPGQTQADVSISTTHSSGKFNNRGNATIGRNGVGSAIVNALSEDYILLSRITEEGYDKSIPAVKELWESCGPRSKKDLFYIVWYKNGIKHYEGAFKLKEINQNLFKNLQNPILIPEGLSTIVLFKLNSSYFPGEKIEIPVENIKNLLLIQDKFYKKKVTIYVEDEIFTSAGFKPYRYEITKTIIPADNSTNPKISVYVTYEVDPGLEAETVIGSVNGLDCRVGVHVNYMTQIYKDALKSEFKITHKYLTPGLKMFVLVLANEVSYDSQTKVRLKGISKVRVTDFGDIMKEMIKTFRRDPDYWQLHVDKLNALANSMKSLSAMDKAQAMIDQASGTAFYRNKSNLVEGFSDATAKNRSQCELFLCEGISPCGSLKSGRKAINGELFHACMPLKGKILNVSNADLERALENKEISTIFTLLGVGVEGNNVTTGCKTLEEADAALTKYCRYGKVVISTDAD